MNEHLKRIISILIILTLILGSYFMMAPIATDAETLPAAGVVTVSNVQVSNTSPKLGDTVRYSFEYSSTIDIVQVDVSMQYGSAGYSSGGAYYEDDHSLWFDVTMESYGEYRINYISFTDANANTYYVHNITTTVSVPSNSTPMDMSATDIYVQTASADTQKPNIDLSSLRIDNKKHFVGDWAEAYVKVTDNEAVNSVGIMYRMGNGTEVSGGAIYMGDNIWKVDIFAEVPGDYKLLYIIATDVSGNTSAIYDSEHSGYRPYEGETKSLSASAFKAVGANPNDKKAPIIHTDTLSVSKVKAGLNEKVVVSVKITEESKLERINPFVQMGKAGICEMSNAFQYNSSTGKYEMTLDSEYYGTWEVMGIHAVDGNGNETLLYNTNMYTGETPYGYFGSPTEKKDMSNSVFYVGITDADTGVFITGNGMSDNVSFDAKHLSKKGDAYDRLYKKGYNVNKFMELKASGNYSEGGHKVKVEFPVDRPSGSKVLIKHLRPNGQVQEEAKTVYGGKVSMYVSDFSPFMILSTDSGELLDGDDKKLTDSEEDKKMAENENKDGTADSEAGDKGGKKDKSSSGGGATAGIIAGVVVIAAAGGGGAYYYLKKKKNL